MSVVLRMAAGSPRCRPAGGLARRDLDSRRRPGAARRGRQRRRRPCRPGHLHAPMSRRHPACGSGARGVAHPLGFACIRLPATDLPHGVVRFAPGSDRLVAVGVVALEGRAVAARVSSERSRHSGRRGCSARRRRGGRWGRGSLRSRQDRLNQRNGSRHRAKGVLHGSKSSGRWDGRCRPANARAAHARAPTGPRGGLAGSDASGRTLLAVRQECQNRRRELGKGRWGGLTHRELGGKAAHQRSDGAERRAHAALVRCTRVVLVPACAVVVAGVSVRRLGRLGISVMAAAQMRFHLRADACGRAQHRRRHGAANGHQHHKQQEEPETIRLHEQQLIRQQKPASLGEERRPAP